MHPYWLDPPWITRAKTHMAWLNGNSGEVARRKWRERWDNTGTSSHDSALSEMIVREVLESQGVETKPGELPGTGGPDFVCTKESTRFVVEATHISDEAMTAATGIPNTLDGKCRCYSLPTNELCDRVTSKVKQLRDVGAPTLVCVTSAHTFRHVLVASITIDALLTGTQQICQDFDPELGEAIGPVRLEGKWDTTPFTNTEGFAPDGVRVLSACRRVVSGVLAIGIDAYGWSARGALHPLPLHRFDPALLPGIEFHELKLTRGTGTIVVHNKIERRALSQEEAFEQFDRFMNGGQDSPPV